MFLVAVTAWLYIPRVQDDRAQRNRAEDTCVPSWIMENKTLEDLAEGREKVDEIDRVGWKARTGVLRRRVGRLFRGQ